MGKYIRTKDGRIEETFDLNINDIKNVENLWCDFHLDNGVLHFTDYFPKEKQTLEILQRELKNVVFVKRKINSDYYDYDYEPIEKEEVLKQADNIEELMRVGDLVFKESGDIFVIQNQAQIDFYIKYKIVNKLFIEDSNGNYIKVAQKETLEGELELL